MKTERRREASKTVCRCETLPFIEKLKTHAEVRNEELGRSVLRRMATTIDLPAAGAKYHNRCDTL